MSEMSVNARKRFSEKDLEEVRHRLFEYGDRFPPNDHEADCLKACEMINSLIAAERELDAVRCELRDAYIALAES